jgi:hypothetical protein
MWSEDHPEWDIIPPNGMHREATSYEDATTNKEFNSPYGTVSFESDLLLYKRTGSVYPSVTKEGRISLGVYKKPKANYRDAINRTSEKFPHLTKDWETYLYPSNEVIANTCHPFEYTRACDLTLKEDYRIILPNEIHPSKKILLDERRKIMPDLNANTWIEIGSLKPCDIIIIQVLYSYIDERDLSSLIKSLRKYPGFGIIAERHNPEDWFPLFKKYRKNMKIKPIAKPEEIQKEIESYEIPFNAFNEEDSVKENEDIDDDVDIYEIIEDDYIYEREEELPPADPDPNEWVMEVFEDAVYDDPEEYLNAF